MVWYFIGVYMINRTLHGRLEIRKFLFECSKQRTSEIFSTREEKFRISKRPCNILSLYILLDGLVCSIVGYFYESKYKRLVKISHDTTH